MFSNAKLLRSTNFSISDHIPRDIEAHEMLGWQEYKQARRQGIFTRSSEARLYIDNARVSTQIAKFLRPIWGPPGSCRPQMGPMLA